MGFKANNTDPNFSWRKKNRSRLIAAGVPDRIAEDDRIFWFVMQEGIDFETGGWTTDWLNDVEARQLCDLLNEMPNKSSADDVIRTLDRRLKNLEQGS